MLLFTTEETLFFYSVSLFNDNTCIVHKKNDYVTKWRWHKDKVLIYLTDEWVPVHKSVTEKYVSYLQTLVES